MAKKKLNNKPNQDQTPTAMAEHQPPMEDPQEKLNNLKSLNDVLLKETLERRQQVESLLRAKESLEIQLAQAAAGKTGFESEFVRESEERVCLEIEKGLFSVFIETQLDSMRALVSKLVRENGEMGDEIGVLKAEISGLKVGFQGEREKFSGICQQRDRLMREVDERKREVNSLKEKVIEMEEKKIQAEEELRKVNEYYKQSIEQLKEKKEQFEEVNSLRDLAEKELAVKVNAIEDLNRSMEDIVRKKNEIERENGEKKMKIGELEKELSEYSGIISSFRMEEGNLRGKLLELESSYGKATDMAKEIAKENDSLVEEKKEKERTIGKLTGEMESREKLIMNLNTELKDKEGLIVALLREKEEIEDVKVSKENEIAKLNEELIGLRDAVVGLQESIKVQEDQNIHLASEVSHYRVTLEQVKLEKDDVQRDLDNEANNSRNLTSRILEMEKRIEEGEKEFTKTKNQHENLVEEKNEMECQIGSLIKDKDSVQKTLLESLQEVDDLRKKVESVDAKNTRALAMIKNTAALLCNSENGKEAVSSFDRKLEGETGSYETELETIKNAFRSKEAVVEEMKQQVKFLQNSVAKASKEKGLLTIVSSATTFLFAVSVAYVARLR